MHPLLNKICQDVYRNVSGSLACALVNLRNGAVVGIYHEVPYFDQNYVNLVAAAAVNMFAGPGIVEVERRLSEQRGQPVRRSIQEAFMTTTHTFHFMAIVSEIDCVVVLVTKKDVLQGLGWTQVRKAVPLFAAQFAVG